MIVSQQRLDHAWEHFKVHSAQRMQHWQYAIAFTGTIYAVLAGAAQFNATAVADVAAAIGLVATTVFWSLDRRTRQLVKASERALKELELELAAQDENASIAIFHHTERPKGLGLSYTQAFSLLFFLNGIAMATLAWGDDLARRLLSLPLP